MRMNLNKLMRMILKVNKNSERYKIATLIAKDYIHTRGLTEVRLSGRVNDRI